MTPVGQTVLELIQNGTLDSDLGELAGAINARRGAQVLPLGGTFTATFPQPGQRVRFKPNVRPKYLRGAVGVAVRKLQKNWEVQLDNKHIGRGFPGGVVFSHVAYLEPE